MVDWNAAFAGQLQPGKKPALLLVDPVNAYLDPQSPLFLDSGKAALEAMTMLLNDFRSRDLPVIFTGVRYKSGGTDGGHFFKKVPALRVFVGESPQGAFPDALIPKEGERVFIKQYPSAFFSTGLDGWLKGEGIDTLFICGFSTSGCVRASALDALQYGFVPIVVSDACADRSDEIHAQNLYDIAAKYGEVIEAKDITGILPGSN